MMATAKSKSIAERRAELEAELASLEQQEKREASVSVAEQYLAWVNGDESKKLTKVETALLLAPLESAGLVSRSGKGTSTAGTGEPFDEAAVLAYLKTVSEPVLMRAINNNSLPGKKMNGKAADMTTLLESNKVVRTGEAPGYKYALA